MFIQICVDISLFKSYYMDVLRKRHNKNKSCTGAKLLREHKMKKTILAALLILAIASTSVFAVPDGTFDVSTTIGEIGKMKVSALEIAGNTDTNYTDSGLFTELEISSFGDQTFEAYLTTLSNKRSGYEVTMNATAMKSEATPTTYIDYTVTCNDKSVTTLGDRVNTVVKPVDVASISELTGQSSLITLTVDQTTFEKAVSGKYVGTVTFNYTAT